MSKSLLLSSQLYAALVEAGLYPDGDENNVRRVVLDLQVGTLPVMYVERYMDQKVLEVFPSLIRSGIEIRYADSPT